MNPKLVNLVYKMMLTIIPQSLTPDVCVRCIGDMEAARCDIKKNYSQSTPFFDF